MRAFLCSCNAFLLNQFMTFNDIHNIGPSFFYATHKDVGHKLMGRKSWIFCFNSCCWLGCWFVTVKVYAYEGFYFTLNDFYAQTVFPVWFLIHTCYKSCLAKSSYSVGAIDLINANKVKCDIEIINNYQEIYNELTYLILFLALSLRLTQTFSEYLSQA